MLGGTVTQPQGTSLSITDATLANPAGTLSISCPLTSITPQYPYYPEWSCVGGSFSFQSADGSIAFSGSITSGTFGLQKNVSGNVTTYDYTLFANVEGSLTVNGQSKAVFGSAVEALAGLSSFLGTGASDT